MKDSQKRYYAHASKCDRCLASIEQGRVNTSCHQGWQIALDVLRELDDPHEGRAYPGQVWVDNIRQAYVEWIADTAGKVVKAIPRSQWKWQGHAGHFVCAENCSYRLATQVGKYLISTVGEYIPAGKQTNKPEEIGYGRTFETMVFTIAGYMEDGCAEIKDYSELDMEGYKTVNDAAAGHEKMCVKWAKQ